MRIVETSVYIGPRGGWAKGSSAACCRPSPASRSTDAHTVRPVDSSAG